jgi:alpha-L-fucosidase 2
MKGISGAISAAIIAFTSACAGVPDMSGSDNIARTSENASANDLIVLAHPAEDLISEGSPIGNGRMGMLIQGGIGHESDAICEDSMWSGWQNNYADNSEAAKYLPEIRKLFDEGNIREAQDLVNKTQVSRTDDGHGHGTYDAYGTYQMMARLEIETSQDAAKASNYVRSLNMSDGTVSCTYDLGGVKYSRSYFCSRPDNVLVIKFESSGKAAISFNVTLARPDTGAKVSTEAGSEILLSGRMWAPNSKGLTYACRAGVKTKGGSVESTDRRIIVKNCDEVILYITAATNYKGIGSWPDYVDESGDAARITKSFLDAAISKNYDIIRNSHTQDMRKLMGRVGLNLQPSSVEDCTTPDAIKNLERIETYFQFGRYLLASSSREGGLPANLQGLWAVNFQDPNQGNHWNYYTPWNGDYHANVNVQMNYWPAFSANLADCARPLYDLIAALPGPGSVTASVQHGCDGWTTHTMNNVWGYTSPGWEASWGHFPMAGPWMATHIWTGYAYTLDKNFLRRMWPALKGSAQFVLSWMTPDKDGMLVSGPSESPENKFRLPDGSIGYFCMGPSMDQELCAQLLDETLRAAKVLGIYDEFTRKCEAALPRIKPVQIGPDGRLLEWTQSYDEPEPGHRHTSHLFGLYPGTTISLEKTPELAAAARKSLECRIAHGGGYTGWSRAMIMGEWARLHDGDKAYENLEALLKDFTLANLFNSGPPFQIDGNFGATAAIVEMLMQSNLERDGTTTIELLPALPNAWPTGHITGIVAQGAVTVDIWWKDGKLEKATLAPKHDITATIVSGGLRKTLVLKAAAATEYTP